MVLILGLLALAVWAVTLSFGFLWDDFPTVVQNPSLREWGTLGSAFTNDFWGLHEIPARSGYWRPIPTVVHALVTLVFGFHPLVFHTLNLSLHVSVSLLAVLLFARIGLGERSALIAGLFFALHPIHSEAVSFVSALPDLLAALLGLGGLLVWMSPAEGIRKLLLGTALFSAALLSKESAVAFALAGVWLTPSRRKLLVLLIPTMVGYAVAHFAVTGGFGSRALWGGAWAPHAATVVRLFPYAIFLTFFPFGSSPTRSFPVSTGWDDPFAWSAFGTFFLLALLVWRFRASNPGFVKSAVLFFLFWLPVSNLVPAEGLLVDRYLYLPALGSSVAIGVLLGRLFRNARRRKIFAWSFLPLVIFWGGWSVKSALKWKNDGALWEHAVRVSPLSPVAWNEYGGILLKKDDTGGARKAFERALTLRPQYREASLNCGVALYRQGDLGRAFFRVQDHLKRFPDDAEAWDLLGTIYVRRNDLPMAIRSGSQAVALAPSNWKHRYNLALTHAQVRDLPLAATELEKARELTGGRREVLSQLGTVYLYAGEWAKAESVFQEVVRRWPEDEEASRELRRLRDIMKLTQGR